MHGKQLAESMHGKQQAESMHGGLRNSTKPEETTSAAERVTDGRTVLGISDTIFSNGRSVRFSSIV